MVRRLTTLSSNKNLILDDGAGIYMTHAAYTMIEQLRAKRRATFQESRQYISDAWMQGISSRLEVGESTQRICISHPTVVFTFRK